MLVTSPDNPLPKVGQLLFQEYRSENGDLEYASLVFVDTQIKEGSQWMYTQIAHLEDTGSGPKVFTGFESGGMPAKYTRVATDEDLKMFIDYIKTGKITEDSINLDAWLEKIRADEILLESEKSRIINLTS